MSIHCSVCLVAWQLRSTARSTALWQLYLQRKAFFGHLEISDDKVAHVIPFHSSCPLQRDCCPSCGDHCDVTRWHTILGHRTLQAFRHGSFPYHQPASVRFCFLLSRGHASSQADSATLSQSSGPLGMGVVALLFRLVGVRKSVVLGRDSPSALAAVLAVDGGPTLNGPVVPSADVKIAPNAVQIQQTH